MISVKKKRSTLGMGHDAFLDIVANLVGVLIILIAVFSGTSAAMVKEAERKVQDRLLEQAESMQASEESFAKLAKLSSRAAAAHHDSDQLERRVDEFDAEIQLRKQERAALMDLQAIAKSVWEEKQLELDQSKVEAAKRQTELASIQDQLTELEGEKARLSALDDSVVAIQHLPTPMAKKAYEDRIVLRLRGDHVSVVPIDPLMKDIAKQVHRTTSPSGRPQPSGVVGPIRGYTARYSLVVGETSAIFHGAIMQPVTEPIGQPIDLVLGGQSEVEHELAGRNPNSTSILVWVYPDSYRALRRLKEYLYSKGFATAVRPRDMYQPIGVARNGVDPSVQ